MAFGHLWAGRVFGTNTGNIFIKLSGNDGSLSGKLHLNDFNLGLAVYNVRGAFDGNSLTLSGEPELEVQGAVPDEFSASATLNAKGELNGEWFSTQGSRGTFVLFPHDNRDSVELGSIKEVEQLHTARHNFGAVAVDRSQISALADEIQSDFEKGEVVVTVLAGTEQSRLLRNFKATSSIAERATVVKLYVQQPEVNGINRVCLVEFGPDVNFAMAQGTEEAWTLGMLEKLKRNIQPFERTYTTTFKKLGFGINQLLLFGAVTYLPSLTTFRDRATLMVGVWAIGRGVNWSHRRLLPHADIYLMPKPRGRFLANAISWGIAATSALAATLLASYLQGRFPSLLLLK